VSNRGLAKLTQPAVGDFLEERQEYFHRNLEAARSLVKVTAHQPQRVRNEALDDLSWAKAFASEWGVSGSECR